ncbi:MAG: ral substrate transporter [Phenylobacterium sp.]|nr:ral substrate transporter [Phenylobacterium sp.]
MTAAVQAEAVLSDAEALPLRERLSLLGYSALPLLLFNFAAPYLPLIAIPVLFFLKNRLHLTASQTALFALITSVPLFLGFVFGFIRDRWSPFGLGDRGHLMVFGLITAAIYAGLAFLPPTYPVLLVGGLMATAAIQLVYGAANGLASTIGRKHAMTGQMSTVMNLANTLPVATAYLLGGVLSGALEHGDATHAARILFLIGAGLMIAVAAFGAFGPRRLFEEGRSEPQMLTPLADLRRLARSWPVYPALLIQLLWQFGPAAGSALQYHLSGDLHATDAQVGAFFSVFLGSFVPVYILYGFLAQRLSLTVLMWLGALLAIPQMAPLLFIHSADLAVWSAVPMGILGGIGQVAFLDLAMRACPKGLEGTMMMLLWSCYWISYRLGDLWGGDIYDHHGGFSVAIWATMGVYAAILPILLLVPRRITSGVDAHAA